MTWDPRGVFLWDGAAAFAPCAPHGGVVGLIPAGSNLNAVFLDPGDALVVSFYVPTTIGVITYDPADLIRHNGVFFDAIPYFDASAAPLRMLSVVIPSQQPQGGNRDISFAVFSS